MRGQQNIKDCWPVIAFSPKRPTSLLLNMIRPGRPARYVAVGIVLTAINYGGFIGGLAMGLNYLVAATISSITTFVIGFFLHHRFTFSARRMATLSEFTSFLSVFAVQYMLGMFAYMVLIGYLRLNATLAFALNGAFLAATQFCFLRYVTFRQHLA